MRVGSRKRGLLVAELLLKAGLTTSSDTRDMLLVTAGFGDTPKALAVEAVMRRRLRSFMMIRSDLIYITNDLKYKIMMKKQSVKIKR
jgi:hypothetical protein